MICIHCAGTGKPIVASKRRAALVCAIGESWNLDPEDGACVRDASRLLACGDDVQKIVRMMDRLGWCYFRASDARRWVKLVARADAILAKERT